MNAEKLGIELARIIEEWTGESINDISGTLGRHVGFVFFEYLALLLWIAVKEVSIILPKEFIQQTIDAMFSASFLLLEKSGARAFEDFNGKTFDGFIHDRFNLYCWAWDAFPIKDEQLSKITVSFNFIVCCFTDGTEYYKLVPKPEDRAAKTCKVIDHYNQFSTKLKHVISLSLSH